jgi:three-Cys-motif partner protein
MVLPDNSPKKWNMSDHTKIKHEILSKYLSGWIHILGNSGYNTINYIDGFAGKGKYNDGSDGSPIIAINAFKNVTHRSMMRFIFIEKNPDNF